MNDGSRRQRQVRAQSWAINEDPFPSAGMPRGGHDLDLPRAKRRSLAVSVGYRVFRLTRRLFGDRRMTALYLDAAWLLRRFAYEISYERFGASFLNSTHAISPEVLERWVSRGSSVVDIGCGYGRLCRLVAPYARRVVGIDRDPVRIDIAKSMPSPGHIEYRVSDVTRELGQESYDVAMLVHVLEHVDDVDHLLREIGQMARVLIVEVPDFDADCLNLVRWDTGRRWYTDADHVREYTQDLLRKHLERNGWTPTDFDHRGGMIAARSVRTA